MKTLPLLSRTSGRASARGFSLIEVLVGLVIFMAVLAIMFTFFVQASQHAATEGTALEAQQGARISLDELERTIRQSGFGIQREDATNPGSWQQDLVHAGAHTIAFNANLDTGIGSLFSDEIIAFPNSDGMEYNGEGPEADATLTGAETYVFTLDADANDLLELADREQVGGAEYNPAADTPVPLDFAVFRRVYGWSTADGDYGGTPQPVGAYLFTSPVDDDATRYPDDSTPHPLFVYWLSEDLDGDGVLDAHECVVDCDPLPTRKPMLYIWGDGGDGLDAFDRELSDEERETLRTLPVGSVEWVGNKLANGGEYLTSTLATSVAGGADISTFTVDDVTGFGSGQFIRIGPADADDDDPAVELLVIDDVDTVANKIFTLTPAETAHAVNQEIRIHPRTLLRAVRSVEIHYDAITPRNESRTPGRSGRQGTRGLEFRVREITSKVELLNHTTAALPDPDDAPLAEVACPVTIEGYCFDTDAARAAATIYVPQAAPVEITFRVLGPGASPAANVAVVLSNSNPSVGTLTDTAIQTDGLGRASAMYTPTDTLGTDTISAVASCTDGNGDPDESDPADVVITIAKVEITPLNACSSTYITEPGTSPQIAYTVTASTSGGPLAGDDLALALRFAEPEDNPERPASFTAIVGDLLVDGASEGITTDAGSFTPHVATTDGSGQIAGMVKLATDTDQAGVLINLEASKEGNGCDVFGTTLTFPFRFNRLSLDSTLPNAGCTPAARCIIAGGAATPWVEATLTRNLLPIEGATVTFTATKVSGPAVAVPNVSPSAKLTDANGKAKVEVGHNNNAAVTPASPLLVDVSASTPGKPSECSAGTIAVIDPKSGFQFNGSAVPACSVQVLQADFRRAPFAPREYCMAIRNIGSCPVRILGIQQRVSTNGTTMVTDAARKITLMGGGPVVAVKDCASIGMGPPSTGPTMQLFIKTCNGGADLNNDQNWMFVSDAPRCYLPLEPPGPVPPGQYFMLNRISYANAYLSITVPPRLYHVTITYECTGDCSGVVPKTSFFTLTAPSTI